MDELIDCSCMSLSTHLQGIQALTWVVVKPAPRDFIENFVGASDFWGNKIRVQYKKTAPPQTAFVDNFKKMIVELMAYVKEWHTTGVTWNPQVGRLQGMR